MVKIFCPYSFKFVKSPTTIPVYSMQLIVSTYLVYEHFPFLQYSKNNIILETGSFTILKWKAPTDMSLIERAILNCWTLDTFTWGQKQSHFQNIMFF